VSLEDPSPGDTQSGGLMQSLRNLAASAAGVLHTRLELLVSELEEERLRILQLLLWGSLALIFLALGVLVLTFAVVILFWDTHRLLAATVLGMAYLAIAGMLATVARGRAQRPRLFNASIAELAKDRDTLSSK
jgi:uncharacterized membrane protein YqjE